MSLKRMAARLYRYPNRYIAAKGLSSLFKSLLIHPEVPLIYVKLPKSGCSTIISRLLPGTGATDAENTRRLHGKTRLIGFEDRDFLPRLARLQDQEYLVFTTARNPFTRLLSAFREKIELNLDGPRYRAEFGFAADDEVTFTAFVDRLVTRDPRFIDPHFQPQSLIARPDLVSYSGIFHLEDMQTCLDWIGAQTGRANGPGAVAPHATGASMRLGDYYDPGLAEKVARYYRDDFVNFGYSSALHEASLVTEPVNSGQTPLAQVAPGRLLAADSWLRARLPGLLIRHDKD